MVRSTLFLMGLRQQIIAGFAILLVPLAIVALLALSTISQLGGVVEAVLQDNDRSLEAAADMTTALERLDSAALLALLDRDSEAAEIAGSAVPRFRQALATAQGNLTIDGEDEIVSEIGAAFDEIEQASAAVGEAEADEARRAYASAFVPAFERARDGVARLESANRSDAGVTARDARATAQTAFWGVAIGSLLALVLGVWAAIRLSRQIASRD